MAPIAGVYQHVKNEKFAEYLMSIGTPEDKAKLADSLKTKLEVKVNGKNISMDSDLGTKTASVTFILDEEVDETLPNNTVLKSLAKLDGDTLTVHSKTPDAKTGTRTYKFSDTELVLTLTTDGESTVGKRFYKRV